MKISLVSADPAGLNVDALAIPVLVLAIGFAGWVQYARTVRGSTLVEREKEYVQAARVMGRGSAAIMVRHVLPNVMGSALVIATIVLAGLCVWIIGWEDGADEGAASDGRESTSQK